jgi:hypothetical protein
VILVGGEVTTKITVPIWLGLFAVIGSSGSFAPRARCLADESDNVPIE